MAKVQRGQAVAEGAHAGDFQSLGKLNVNEPGWKGRQTLPHGSGHVGCTWGVPGVLRAQRDTANVVGNQFISQGFVCSAKCLSHPTWKRLVHISQAKPPREDVDSPPGLWERVLDAKKHLSFRAERYPTRRS